MGDVLNFPAAMRLSTSANRFATKVATTPPTAECHCRCGKSDPPAAIQVKVENCHVEISPGAGLEVLYAQLTKLFRR